MNEVRYNPVLYVDLSGTYLSCWRDMASVDIDMVVWASLSCRIWVTYVQLIGIKHDGVVSQNDKMPSTTLDNLKTLSHIC